MFSPHYPSQIQALYGTSTLLSLIVLVLALLDLGFGSLFLGLVGPFVLFMHHGCTLLYLRGSGTKTVRLITSMPSLVTVGLLAGVWLAGSIVVTIWGALYMHGKAQMVVQAVGTPATVVAQGAIGLLETLVLVTMFGTLIHMRGQEVHQGLLNEKVDESATMSAPHRNAETIPVTNSIE